MVGGRRRSIYGKTRKEVADKLADALAEKDDVAVFVPSNITVAEFLAQYEDVVRGTMKRRSLETYQSIAKVHLLPEFGALKLADLGREQVKRMYPRKRDGALVGEGETDTRGALLGPQSRRQVALDRAQPATEALEGHRERQAAEGFSVEGDVLVFTNTVGKSINPSHLLCRSFKPLLRKAGLPDTTFHAATTHTCCCILLAQGVNPRVVSLQLGHSSVALTLQRYALFMPGFDNNGATDLALS